MTTSKVALKTEVSSEEEEAEDNISEDADILMKRFGSLLKKKEKIKKN